MTRDWSNVFAQEIYECDDKTLDVLLRKLASKKAVDEGHDGDVENDLMREIEADFFR